MKLKGCITSHFVSIIQDGMVKKVHNTDSYGNPNIKFKNLKDIYQAADAEHTSMPQYGYDDTKFDFADRKTKAINGYVVMEDEPECPSDENCSDKLTLSQLRNKSKKKKRKALESILSTPKTEDDDSDLGEPLCKFRVKGSKSSHYKKMPANESLLTAVNVKVEEAPEVDYLKCRVMTRMADNPSFCNGQTTFIASESGIIFVNCDPMNSRSVSFTNEGENCGYNEALLDNLDNTPQAGEDMVLDNEENMTNVNQPSSIDDFLIEDLTTSSSDCSQTQPYIQQTPEQVSSISGVQDSDSRMDEDAVSIDIKSPIPDADLNSSISDEKSFLSEDTPNLQDQPYLDNTHNTPQAREDMVLDNEENMANVNQPSSADDSLVEELTTSTSDCSQTQPYLQQIPEQVNSISNVQDSDSTIDDMDEDAVSIDIKSPIPDADLNSLNSDKKCFLSGGTPNLQEQPSLVPANSDSEVNMSDHNHQTDIKNDASDCIEPRLPERLPSTRKAISPNSQEKLRIAMKSAELLDDIDHYKCKEKLSFEEQSVITPKQMLKKPKSYKKGFPREPRSSLEGPRLCRSLPRLSTGCTSIQGCSENAIAFSQRQMHDIESLASKLLSELNSMKVMVEEKMLFEAYRSPSLKNEADEVKSAIKSATKTEESAKKWLSMMARDCNRFCKIMKLNEDKDACGCGEAGKIEEKSLVQRERKKISFADEAGGLLCDIKVYEIDETCSLNSKQKPES